MKKMAVYQPDDLDNLNEKIHVKGNFFTKFQNRLILLHFHSYKRIKVLKESFFLKLGKSIGDSD